MNLWCFFSPPFMCQSLANKLAKVTFGMWQQKPNQYIHFKNSLCLRIYRKITGKSDLKENQYQKSPVLEKYYLKR